MRTAGVRFVRRLRGLQMMKADVLLSVCDVYTRLCTVLHAGAAEHELYSRSASRMLELAFVRDVTVTAGGGLVRRLHGLQMTQATV